MKINTENVVDTLRDEYDIWIKSLSEKEKYAIEKYSWNSFDVNGRKSFFKIPSGNSRPFKDRDESVFYFRFQYLKNKINCFTSAFRISVKKVVHCSVISYK